MIGNAGRIHSKRKASSKLIFYDIVQDGQMIQAVASRSNFAGTDDEFLLANKHLHRGDIVGTLTNGSSCLF